MRTGCAVIGATIIGVVFALKFAGGRISHEHSGHYAALLEVDSGNQCYAKLDFLAAICVRSHYQAMFNPDVVLETMAGNVAVKNLMLRTEHLEMHEDEPLEYIEKDLEGTDSGTQRRIAVDVVLCKECEGEVMPMPSSVFSSFAEEAGYRMKFDMVYCIVCAMVSRAETIRHGATSSNQLALQLVCTLTSINTVNARPFVTINRYENHTNLYYILPTTQPSASLTRAFETYNTFFSFGYSFISIGGIFLILMKIYWKCLETKRRRRNERGFRKCIEFAMRFTQQFAKPEKELYYDALDSQDWCPVEPRNLAE